MFPCYCKYKLKLFILILIVLKYSNIPEESSYLTKWIESCNKDFYICQTFATAEKQNCCPYLLENITIERNDISGVINSIFGIKQIDYGHMNVIDPIVLKRIATQERLDWMLNTVDQYLQMEYPNSKRNNWKYFVAEDDMLKILTKMFINENRLDGTKICPTRGNSFNRFLSDLQKNTKIPLLHLAWLMNINLEPALLKLFNQNDRFPTPKFYKLCGLTVIESLDGHNLYNFYDHSFRDRLFLAQQLLRAAINFTNGFNGFRFYLTDITPDNIVVNPKTLSLSFIDLDSLIILDSLASGHLSDNNDQLIVHKHELIECKGCFAYIPDEICNHYKSDINIFATCQMLRQDLHGNFDNGLLHTIPESISNKDDLMKLLANCMECSNDCENRFSIVEDLMSFIDDVLKFI